MRISDWSSDVCSSDLQFIEGDALELQGDAAIDLGMDDDVVRGVLGQAHEELARRRVEYRHIEATALLIGRQMREIVRSRCQQIRTHRGRWLHRCRSEARRVGKECVRTVSTRWSPDH